MLLNCLLFFIFTQAKFLSQTQINGIVLNPSTPDNSNRPEIISNELYAVYLYTSANPAEIRPFRNENASGSLFMVFFLSPRI